MRAFRIVAACLFAWSLGCSGSSPSKGVCVGAACDRAPGRPIEIPPGPAPRGEGGDAVVAAAPDAVGPSDAGASRSGDAPDAVRASPADVASPADAAGPGTDGGGGAQTVDAVVPADAATPVDAGGPAALSCAEVLACTDSCAPGDNGCVASCTDEGTAQAKLQLAALWGCIQGECPYASEDELLVCIAGECAEPFAQCVAQGDAACVPTVGCMLACNEADCMQCALQASPKGLEGAARLFAQVMEECWGEPGTCALVALLDDDDALKGCGLLAGHAPCRDAAKCLRQCFEGSLDALVTCELACLAPMRADAVPALGSLLECVIEVCLSGTARQPLGCAASEVTWEALCEGEWSACEGGGD